MSELSSELSAEPSAPTCGVIGCPPPAERSPESASDPRADLLAMAATLSRTRNHRLLIEYLRLRRAAG